MILADKIAILRKRNGWSQEELADQLGVSRQSVSKWEAASSIPDLNKILKMSQIFGVTTDYLLKDDMEELPVPDLKIKEKEEFSFDVENENPVRKVSMEEADTFMKKSESASKMICIGVAACICSPIPLIFLAGWLEVPGSRLTEQSSAAIGLLLLFLIIAAAVVDFIITGLQLSRYDYLEKELIDLEYGVYSVVKEKDENFSSRFAIGIAIGVMLIIVGIIPLVTAGAMEAPDHILVSCVCLMLAMIAAGVFLFIRVGMVKDSYQKLMQSGDYTRSRKKAAKKLDAIGGIYWTTVTAIYLAISFISFRWDRTWIIWPVAGVLYAAVVIFFEAREKNRLKQ